MIGGEYRSAARIGVLVVLVAPFAVFAIRYWTSAGASSDGFVVLLLTGILDGIVGLISWAVAQPAAAILYLAVFWALQRFAFGPRHRSPARTLLRRRGRRGSSCGFGRRRCRDNREK